MRRCILLLAFIGPLLLSVAYAQTGRSIIADSASESKNESTGSTFAMIVGISSYKHLPELSYADKDALLFYDFLISKAGGNVPDSNIFRLINEEAKAATFWAEGMAWLRKKKLKQGDKLYIYMAGHGDAINDEEYFFLTYDCAPQGSKDNYIATGNIPLYNLKVRIANLTRKGVEVLLIMDACRTNELPGGNEGQKSFLNSIAEKKAGEIIMLSAGPNQKAIEAKNYGAGHGLFTYFLVDGLFGTADESEEGDRNGKVNLYELSNWVRKKVKTEASNRFKSTQIPFFCCPEDDLKVISKIDSLILTKWQASKEISLVRNSNKRSGGSASRSAEGIILDQPAKETCQKFYQALKTENLAGTDSSAEYFLRQFKHLSGDTGTISELEYALASELINYAQEKINVYLMGHDIAFVQKLKKQDAFEPLNREIAENVLLIEKVEKESFSKAALYLEKGIALLKNEDEYAQKLLPKLYFLKAKCYYEKNPATGISLSDAIKLTREAIKLDSTLSYNYQLIASLLLEDKQYERALQALNRAFLLNPGWQYLCSDFGYAYMQLKQYKEAKKYYELAYRLDSTNISVLNNLGASHFNLGEINKAIFYFKKVIAKSPRNSQAQNNLGISYKKLNQKENAKKHLFSAISTDKKNCEAYYNLGNLYLAEKDYKNAEAAYSSAIECDPLAGDYLYNLAYVYFKELKYDQAKQSLTKAIALDPGNALLYSRLGDISRSENNFGSAESNYRKAILLDSLLIPARVNLGITYYQTGNYSSAEKEYLIAEKLAPGNTDLTFNFGLLYEKTDRLDNAVARYLSVLKSDTNNIPAMINIGRIYSLKNSLDTAGLFFKKVIRKDPRNVAAFTNLGNIHYTREEWAKAEVNYLNALKYDPGNKSILSYLFSIYTIQGQSEKANQIQNRIAALKDH